MNLFVCTTPLQVMICKNIINHKKLLKNDVRVIYVAKNINKVVLNSIDKANEISSKLYIIDGTKSSILYLPKVLFICKRHKIKSLYCASIDLTLVHFILSHVKDCQLHTFDDGTANIFPDSIYSKNLEFSISKRLFRKVIGVKYNLNDLKRRSILHYSIYNKFQNIIEPVEFIPLAFDIGNVTDIEGAYNKECNVIIGSVYKVLFTKNVDIEAIISKCEDAVTKIKTYYIPHPGDGDNIYFNGFDKINSTNIAEIEILNLLDKYKTVNVYGFMSSCQFNISGVSRIKNHIFYSTDMNFAYRRFYDLNLIPENFDVIFV